MKSKQVSINENLYFGKIPDDWKWKTVDEIKDGNKALVSGPFGSNIGKKFFRLSGTPVIRGNNLKYSKFIDSGFVFIDDKKTNELKNCEAVFNDIIFTAAGTIGQVGIIPKNSKYLKYIISNKQLRLRVNPNMVLPLFSYYWFSSKKMQDYLILNNVGSALPLLTLRELKSVPIPIPSIIEQEKICSHIENLNTKIENLQNQNHTLEQTAQAIFKSWFVDFDGVTEFEDSELGKIPKGWDVKPLHQLCTLIKNGGTPKRMEATFWENGTIDWYKTGELQDNFLLGSEEKITELGLKNSSAHLLPENTILFAIYAFPVVGRMGILTKPSCSNQAASGLIPKNEIGTYFLFLSLMFSRNILGRIATGAAQQNISKDILQNHSIIMPPLNLISKFNKNIVSIFLKIKVTSTQIESLTKTRDTLLPKLMSGEIRV